MPSYPYICECEKCSVQFRSSKYHDRLCSFHKSKSKQVYPRVFWKNKKIVLVRDEYKCQCCGCVADGKNTNQILVHHIDCDKGNNSPSNLITLCQQCHDSLHHKYKLSILRRSNIYQLFAKDIRFGEFGKNLIYEPAKQLVKKQFNGKPKLFFKTTKPLILV